MKKKMSFIGFMCGAILSVSMLHAAEPVQRRGAVATSTGVSSRSGASASPAAVPARAAAASGVTSRSATPSATTTTRVRAGTVTPAQTVSARAGAVQKVVQTGTGISAATTNTVVDATCRERYFGCMDSFCMLENDNGGRCLCSDKKADYDDILKQIETLDAQSYALATTGVEKIDMGAKADYVFDIANQIEADTVKANTASSRQQNRLNIDLNLLTQTDFGIDTNIFDVSATNDISNKTGDALRTAVNNICSAQMAGCEKDLQMLQMMYTQNVASDCRAYENELNKRKNSSAQKLSTAQSALRAAALESFETSNKWDLGQCTIQMKKCVQDNGCGEDFTGCVNLAATANASGVRSTKMSRIKGPNTYIEIAASSLDALESKKALCFDTVTASCVAVRGRVWDSFLADVAPAVKSAELVAESNIRMSCIGNISECFQKACRDTMDPNNPDGSYDLCLSRPEAIEHLCKVQIDQCSVTDAKDTIMDFVRARLAAMRVDACTAQAKACFTADTACGKNFENCIGLGLDDIKKMCPLDTKLTACNATEEQRNSIDSLIQGIYLSMDNSALEQCQRYADEKMIEVCGDTASCEVFGDDAVIGTESLTSRKNNNGDYVIEGLMNYGLVTITDANKIDDAAYLDNLSGVDSRVQAQIKGALSSVSNKIANKIAILENDTKIDFCIQGRQTRQITGIEGRSGARFPHLLDNYKKVIIDSALATAKKNYTKKYNELYSDALTGQSTDVKRATCMALVEGMESAVCSDSDSGTDSNAGSVVSQCKNWTPTVASATANVGGQEIDESGTIVTVSGIKTSDMVTMTLGSSSEYVQMSGIYPVAHVSVNAVYSESTGACTITTTTKNCKDDSASGIQATWKLCKDAWSNKTNRMNCFKEFTLKKNSEFLGAMCKSFEEPVTTQTVIQM